MEAMTKEEPTITVKELERETLRESPPTSTTTADRPVPTEVRETISAALVQALRRAKR
jgi:hypothetical protein